jgi:hypothetical protein
MARALNILPLRLISISVDFCLYHPESHNLAVESVETSVLPRPKVANLTQPLPDHLPSLPHLARQPGLWRDTFYLPYRPQTLLLHAPALPHALLFLARHHLPKPICLPHVHPLPCPTLARTRTASQRISTCSGPLPSSSEIFLAVTA